MSRRPALSALVALLAVAPTPAQTNNYVWASIDQGSGLSYWNKFTNAQAWYLNGGPLGTGYPGDSYTGHSGDTDTAAFPAWVNPDIPNNIPGSINPIVNPDPSEGDRAYYQFASLSVDNTGPQGWTFNVPAGSNPIPSLNLQSNGTALTVTSSGSTNTTTFNNAFGLGNNQSWSIDGKTTFNGGVSLGTKNLTITQQNSTTSTVGTVGLTSSGGSLTVGGTGTVVVAANSSGLGGVTVNSSATLAGNATITLAAGKQVSVAGTAAPGTGGTTVGTLTFGASGTTTTTTVGGFYNFDLSAAGTGGAAFNSGASGGTKDLLSAFGTLNFSAGAKVNINALAGSGFNQTLSYSWLIASVNGGSLTGTPDLNSKTGEFAGVTGGEFAVSVLNDAVYLNFTPVPEPGWILGAAAIVIGLARRPRGLTIRGACPHGLRGAEDRGDKPHGSSL